MKTNNLTYSNYIDISEDDIKLLKRIDKQHEQHRSLGYVNLNSSANNLLAKLKASENKELKIFALDKREMDAASILAQSGEIQIYQNDNEEICISPNSTLFTHLFVEK